MVPKHITTLIGKVLEADLEISVLPHIGGGRGLYIKLERVRNGRCQHVPECELIDIYSYLKRLKITPDYAGDYTCMRINF